MVVLIGIYRRSQFDFVKIISTSSKSNRYSMLFCPRLIKTSRRGKIIGREVASARCIETGNA